MSDKVVLKVNDPLKSVFIQWTLLATGIYIYDAFIIEWYNLFASRAQCLRIVVVELWICTHGTEWIVGGLWVDSSPPHPVHKWLHSHILGKVTQWKFDCHNFTIILHWTRSGEVACYPKQSCFRGNLLTLKGLQCSKLDVCVRSKVEVYSGLINLLSLPGQWQM